MRWSVGKDEVGTAVRALGAPGDEGVVTKTRVDLRTDHLILTLDAPPKTAPRGIEVLAMDEREKADEGERIWFPFEDILDSRGRELVEGSVTSASAEGSIITLDREIFLSGESGSPIISQRTGRVIGTLSRSGEEKGKTIMIIAPGASIVAKMRQAEKEAYRPRLIDVIGKGAKVELAEVLKRRDATRPSGPASSDDDK